MPMVRTQTLVQLTDELIALLDKEATRRGVSRSALIREALDAYLSDVGNARKVALWRAGYEQHPAGIADEWGDLEAMSAEAADETVRGLDVDEGDPS